MYAIIGGFIFRHLELTNELNECRESARKYQNIEANTVDSLHDISVSLGSADDVITANDVNTDDVQGDEGTSGANEDLSAVSDLDMTSYDNASLGVDRHTPNTDSHALVPSRSITTERMSVKVEMAKVLRRFAEQVR